MASKVTFNKWAKKAEFETDKVKKGVMSGWPFYERREVRQVSKVEKVFETSRGDVFGMSLLKSKTLALNPRNLGKNMLLWATTLLHESVHAVQGGREKSALDAEWKFLGQTFKRAISLKNRDLARNSVRLAIIANKQRERDVPPGLRENDHRFLVQAGFPENVARVILVS